MPPAVHNPISHVHVQKLSALGSGARNAENHAFESGKVLASVRAFEGASL